MVRGTWIRPLLFRLGAPRNDPNLKFMWGWWQWEGGGGGPRGNIWPTAKNNWLNTQRPALGSTPFNEQGVQNYPLWLTGLNATYKTITNGKYPDIIAALRSGQPFLRQPLNGLSIWMSGQPVAGNPEGLLYANRVIAAGLRMTPDGPAL